MRPLLQYTTSSITQCVQCNTIGFAGVPNDQCTVPARSCIRLDYILCASSTAGCTKYLFDHVSVGAAIVYLVVLICFDCILLALVLQYNTSLITQCVQCNTIGSAGVPNDQRTVPVRSCISLD